VIIIAIATQRPRLHSHQSDAPQYIKTLDSAALKSLYAYQLFLFLPFVKSEIARFMVLPQFLPFLAKINIYLITHSLLAFLRNFLALLILPIPITCSSISKIFFLISADSSGVPSVLG
jgi:hypothetical protein